MTRPLSWLLVLLLLGGFVGAVAYALWLRADAGKGMPDYSVYSAEPDGLRDAARFLRRAGWEPVAVTRPIAATRYAGLLVLVEPGKSWGLTTEYELPAGDARALLQWVAAGNTLLYCGRHGTPLHEALGAGLISDETDAGTDPVQAEVGDAGLYTDGVRHITVEGKNQLRTARGLPLWWVGDSPGAVLLRHGQGRVLLVADASLLTNEGLRRGDNGVFFYQAALRDAQGGKVYFDEYHHGLHSGGGVWGYLAYHRAHWVLVPIGICAGLAAWSLAVRLGPAVSVPEPTRADAVDYASAVARIYARAGVRRLPARALVQGFLGALTRHLRLRRNALPVEVLRAWREQHPGDSGPRLQALLRGVTALRKGDVTAQQLLEWSQAFDRFQREMMRAR